MITMELKLSEYEKGIMALAKSGLGITSTVRDGRIGMLVRGVIDELETVHNITPDPDSTYQSVFIADWVEWRYSNRDSAEGMPRHLDYRLKNMIVKNVVSRHGKA